MLGKDQIRADVVSVFEEAMALNAKAEQSGDEAVIRKVSLAQAQRALRVLISWLNTDPAFQAGGWVRVLAPLHSGLHNTARGAQPPFLFEQARPASSGTRPTELMHDYVRGHIAFGLELLVGSIGGMSEKPALAWLIAEMRKLKVVAEDGAPIEAQQIKRWRYEIKQGTAPKISRAQFHELAKLYAITIGRIKALPRDDRANAAKERVRYILKNLANLAPRDAPAKLKQH
jgi:hypothetical protein